MENQVPDLKAKDKGLWVLSVFAFSVHNKPVPGDDLLVGLSSGEAGPLHTDLTLMPWNISVLVWKGSTVVALTPGQSSSPRVRLSMKAKAEALDVQ